MSAGGASVLEALERAAKLMSPPFPLDEKDPPEAHAYYAPAALLRDLRDVLADGDVVVALRREAVRLRDSGWTGSADRLESFAALLSPTAGPTEKKGNE